MKFAGRGVAEQTVVVKQNMSEKEEKDERVEVSECACVLDL